MNVATAIPPEITTEDELRRFVLDQGINWWDFVKTPEYEEWLSKHGQKAIHVRPYIRQGRPVIGYERAGQAAEVEQRIADAAEAAAAARSKLVKPGKGRPGLRRPRKGAVEYAQEQAKTPLIAQDALKHEMRLALNWHSLAFAHEPGSNVWEKFGGIRVVGSEQTDEHGNPLAYDVYYNGEHRGTVPAEVDGEPRKMYEVVDAAIPHNEQPYQQWLDEYWGKPGQFLGRYQRASGDPGTEFVDQHERIMETGARLDAEVSYRTRTETKAFNEIMRERKRLERVKNRLKKQRDQAELLATARILEEKYGWEFPGEWNPMTGYYDKPPDKAKQVRQRLNAYKRELKKPWDKIDRVITNANQDVYLAFGEAVDDPEARRIQSELMDVIGDRTRLAEPLVEARDAMVVARRAAAYDVLGQVRPFGGDLMIVPTSLTEEEGAHGTPGLPTDLDKAAYASVSQAERWLPRKWIEASNAAQTLAVASHERRGFYRHNSQPVAGQALSLVVISPSRERLGLVASEGVAVHELGHRAEATVDGIKGAEWAFYQPRVSTGVGRVWEPTFKLRDATGIDAYRENEETRRDEFVDLYAGKTYGDEMDSTWEVLTSGIEDLVDGSNGILENDPEYRQFILGMLALS